MKKLTYSSLALSAAILCACAGGGSKTDKAFARGEYETVIQTYQAEVAKGKDLGENNFKIAEAYRLSNRLQEAEPFYKAAIDNGNKKEEAMFNYGMALKANGKYQEAEQQFTSYASVAGNTALKARATTEANNLKNISKITRRYEVANIDAINSPNSDFSPAMAEGEVVFSSARGGGKTYLGNGEPFTDLYAIKFDNMESMTGGTARTFADVINKSETHEASATFSKDGKTAIFARSNTGSKEGAKEVDLFISRNKSGVWSEPKAISVNSKDAWDSTPALSPDGLTLYFASNRTGGQGGTDIYKTTLDATGRFSTPANMGPAINTAGNESFPYVAPDGGVYFASDGQPGLGGLDLFKVVGGKAENMGADVNSTGDDFGIMITAKETGLFSSNRAGGKGKDDIYSFKKIKPKTVTFYAEAMVKETGSGTPLTGAKVTLYGANNNKVTEQMTDASGKVRIKLDSVTAYSIVAEKDKYFANRQQITTVSKRPAQKDLPAQDNDIAIPVNMSLDKIVVNKAIVLNDIFYDYNKWDIRPEAAVILDTLAQTLRDNPKLFIELSSHTDSRGKDAFNLDLSQKRAQSAVDYIVSKGIEKGRITAKGYGETKPVMKDAKTEEDHQKNRRTEFKVTKVAGEQAPAPSTPAKKSTPKKKSTKKK
jgi:peptidoglycan-associated lipoprotein